MISCRAIIDAGGEFTGKYIIYDIREDFTAQVRVDIHYDKMTKRQLERLHQELRNQRKVRNIA